MNKIYRKLCLSVFSLAIVFSIYSVGYAGEQGAVGLMFVPFGIGFSCLVITVIFWAVRFFKKNKR